MGPQVHPLEEALFSPGLSCCCSPGFLGSGSPGYLASMVEVLPDLLVLIVGPLSPSCEGSPKPPGLPSGCTSRLSGCFCPSCLPRPPRPQGPPDMSFMQPNTSALDQTIADMNRSFMKTLAP